MCDKLSLRTCPQAHTPPPQSRAVQEDEDEERLGWFVRQLQPDVNGTELSPVRDQIRGLFSS